MENSYLCGRRTGIKPAVRKGSWRMSWGVGRVAGSARKSRVISDRAFGLMCIGIRYSFRFILWYVSFKLSVSNGGFPTNKVYLKIVISHINNKIRVCVQLTDLQYAPNWPYVDFITVSLLAENFRSNVVGGTTQCSVVCKLFKTGDLQTGYVTFTVFSLLQSQL